MNVPLSSLLKQLYASVREDYRAEFQEVGDEAGWTTVARLLLRASLIDALRTCLDALDAIGHKRGISVELEPELVSAEPGVAVLMVRLVPALQYEGRLDPDALCLGWPEPTVLPDDPGQDSPPTK